MEDYQALSSGKPPSVQRCMDSMDDLLAIEHAVAELNPHVKRVVISTEHLGSVIFAVHTKSGGLMRV